MTEATNPALLEAARGGPFPRADRVAAGVLCIPIPFQRSDRLRYTLCYAIADSDGGTHLLDAGYPSSEGLEVLDAALLANGFGPVRSAVFTHDHIDHAGSVDMLRSRGSIAVIAGPPGATVKGGRPRNAAEAPRRLDEWGVPRSEREALPGPPPGDTHVATLAPDLVAEDGDLLPVPGRRLRLIATPGHTGGHICLHDEDQDLLFTGDHVLPILNPGLGLGGEFATNPVRAYLDSLRRVQEYDSAEACPGHEYRFRGLASRAEAIANHHLRRTREVAEALAVRPRSTIWEIAARLSWTAGWETLRHERFIWSALSQTEFHAEFVRSGEAASYL